MPTLPDKQKLILFFLACSPGIRDTKSMINVYERADYPFGVGEHLKALFDLQFIRVTVYLDNGRPGIFEITELGQAYLNEQVDRKALIDYIRTFQAPEFLLEVVQSCLGNTQIP